MIVLAPFISAFNWILDPKNRNLIGAGIIVLLLILLMTTCGRVSTLQGQVQREKQETQRVVNNWQASQDSVEMLTGANGELVGRIDGYVLTLDELEDQYADLQQRYKIEKNKPPVVITNTVTEIKETTIYVNTTIEGDSIIEVSDSANYGPVNFRYLSGKIPYTIDTTLNRLETGKGIFALEQSIALQTVLTRDKKTGKIEIQVSTDYPGVTFSQIQGAVIQDDKENKKVLKQARKEWGASVQVGFGAMLDMSQVNRNGVVRLGWGPYVGFGIHYSPKWAQWGK
jgi:hypothetical protein